MSSPRPITRSRRSCATASPSCAPATPVLGEEHGGSAVGPGVHWVVDPIDGTVNFLYGLPWYAVSVAAVRDGRSLAGAVVEPASGRVWSAGAGAGAPRATGCRCGLGRHRRGALAAGHRLLLPRRAAGPAGGDDRRGAAARAGRAAHRVGGAGPVRGGGGLGRRLPGARLQLVGLGGGGARGRRGGRRGSHAGGGRPTCHRRTGWAPTRSTPRPPRSPTSCALSRSSTARARCSSLVFAAG